MMMSRVKITTVAVFAVLVLSTVVAGSASAGWFISTKALGVGKSAALASLASVHGSISLTTTVGASTFKISCTGPIHITNGRILEPDLAFAVSIVFLNCNTVAPTPTACHLREANETITTNPVLALATLNRLTIRPETGNTLTEITFAETFCVLAGPNPVNGSVTVATPKGQSEEVEHGIEGLGSVENSGLEFLTGKAFIEGGKALVLLAGGSKWSFK